MGIARMKQTVPAYLVVAVLVATRSTSANSGLSHELEISKDLGIDQDVDDWFKSNGLGQLLTGVAPSTDTGTSGVKDAPQGPVVRQASGFDVTWGEPAQRHGVAAEEGVVRRDHALVSAWAPIQNLGAENGF